MSLTLRSTRQFYTPVVTVKVYNAIASGDPERAKNMMTYMIDEAMAFIEKEIADKEAAQ